ncbi:MAG: hypothetical protein CMJ78_09460 [Planctomycetaceae bacterium]|nr:hypothetical protein [Planctomycetaceae bacterium]
MMKGNAVKSARPLILTVIIGLVSGCGDLAPSSKFPFHLSNPRIKQSSVQVNYRYNNSLTFTTGIRLIVKTADGETLATEIAGFESAGVINLRLPSNVGTGDLARGYAIYMTQRGTAISKSVTMGNMPVTPVTVPTSSSGQQSFTATSPGNAVTPAGEATKPPPVHAGRNGLPDGCVKVDANTRLRVGMRVKASEGPLWYDCKVLALNGPNVKIHWIGWGDSWNQEVPRSRLDLPKSQPPGVKNDAKQQVVAKQEVEVAKQQALDKDLVAIPFDVELPQGTRLQGEFAGRFSPVEVVEAKDDGSVFVRWIDNNRRDRLMDRDDLLISEKELKGLKRGPSFVPKKTIGGLGEVRIGDVVEFKMGLNWIDAEVVSFKSSHVRVRVDFLGKLTELPAQPSMLRIPGPIAKEKVVKQPKEDAPKPKTFEVVLEGVGGRKFAVVKVITEVTEFGLSESREVIDNLPISIKKGLTAEDAASLKKKFESAGAKVTVK